MSVIGVVGMSGVGDGGGVGGGVGGCDGGCDGGGAGGVVVASVGDVVVLCAKPGAMCVERSAEMASAKSATVSAERRR